MTRYAVIMVLGFAGVAFWGDSAGAIDVKPKADTARAVAPLLQRQPRESKLLPQNSGRPQRVLLDRLKRQVREKDSSTSSKFDNYIDANGNGIDDRLEKTAKIKEPPRNERPARMVPEHRLKSKAPVRRPTPKEKP